MSPDPSHPQHFDSAGLLVVMPIGATVAIPHRELTIASIERYRDGFVVPIAYEESAEQSTIESIIELDAHDDRGGRYSGRPLGGHGGGAPGGSVHHRMLYGFTPALDPDAATLTLDGVDAAAISAGTPHTGPPGWSVVPRGERWSVQVPLHEVRREVDESGDEQTLELRAREIRRVIPAGARQTNRSVTVAAYSIELYRQGFVVLAGIEYPGLGMLIDGPGGWSLTDDLGTSYECFNYAGGGLPIAADRSTWRIDLMCAPAIDPLARRIALRMDVARLRYYDQPVPLEYRSSQRDGKVDIIGNWRLDVDLTATGG